MEAKQKYLREKLKDRRIKYNYHDAKTSFLEAVFAKGDRKLADLLEWAVRNGCRFDGWSDQFRYDTWMEGFAELQIDPGFYAHRVSDYDDVMPWEHLNGGVSKKFLVLEHHKALKAGKTPDCRKACTGCGVCQDGYVYMDLKG